MSNTERYRNQHDELLKVATEIGGYLNISKINGNEDHVRGLLATLLGKLGVHLSMEDKSLYPKLLKNPDSKVNSLAKKFMDEMGGIGEAVNAYKLKWPTGKAIKENPSEYIKETSNLFSVLTKRIDKENSILYKMVDEL